MQLTYNIEGSPEIHLDVLRAICGDTSDKSMVDLCCGFAPQTRQLGFKNKLYIDLVARDLGSENPHFLQANIAGMDGFGYDFCFLLDAIEHFNESDGYRVIARMNKLANCSIIFTPLGEYCIEKEPTLNQDEPDHHRSGWTPEDFTGWASIVFPNFHSTLGIGAFFTFHCENIEQEFERIKSELNKKSWAK